MKNKQLNKPWLAHVLTIFPDMFPGPLKFSLAGQALQAKIWELKAVDLRNFSIGQHHSIDDKPYGGGSGMVMRPDVVGDAIESLQKSQPNLPIIYLTPHGDKITQQIVNKFSAGPGIIAICGRFEGIDNRVMEVFPGYELSLGDYVLSGGEPATIALLDACVRLLPGVLGDANSLKEESFNNGLLEYPHFTRPQKWLGREVPEVLVSGHHKKIHSWRLDQARAITKKRRPDLWEHYLDQNS